MNYLLPLAAEDCSCYMLPVKVLLFGKADPSLLSIKIELTGHLGVIIPLLAKMSQFPFFSKEKFWRHPLDQFDCNSQVVAR